MRETVTLLAVGLLLIPFEIGAQDDAEALKKRVADAESAVKMVRVEMESLFVTLNADFDLVRSERWTSLRNPFVDTIRTVAEAKRTDPEVDVGVKMAEGFREANLLSTTAADRLAALAAEAVPSADGAADPDAILTTAVKALFPAETFQECWEGDLAGLAVVVRWREANTELTTAKKALAERIAADAEPPSAPPGMVLVAKGPFEFGPWPSWDNDLRKKKGERARLAAYFIDVHEVTNDQFSEFLGTLPAEAKAEYLPLGFSLDEGKIVKPADAGQLPVRGIPFAAARDYAEWAGKRLPTEEEWEKAARGENGLEYPWGKEFVEDAANWRGRWPDAASAKPVPVGSSPGDRSPYGVLDLAGNVSEFTANMSGRSEAKKSLGTTDEIVYRGGSYADDKSAMTGTYRWIIPALQGADTVGFRCVLSEKDWKPK